MQPQFSDVPTYEDAVARLRQDQLRPAMALYKSQVTRLIESGDINHSIRASRILLLLQRRVLDDNSW